MDLKQMLPLLMKGRLGEREKALLSLTENPDPAALGDLLTRMYDENAHKKTSADLYATLKRIMPAATLGLVIKYNAEKRKHK